MSASVAAPAGRCRFPATFGQRQLWYLHALDAQGSAYNIAFAFELRGDLDRSALEGALAALRERHEALRTGFELIDGELHQIVHDHVPETLPFTDLASATDAERDAELARQKASFARHRFDLAAPTLLRLALLRLEARRHVLLWCIHHSVVDHQAVLRLGEELAELYGAGPATPMDDPATARLQMADYAVWQREQLTDGAIAQRLDYWRGALQGAPNVLALPLDRPRPPVQGLRGAEIAVAFDAVDSRALRGAAQRLGQSPFMLMLAALAIVLQRYSSQRTVVVGCPLANRPTEELQDVVGLFMNVVPIAIAPAADESCSALVAQVRQRMVKAQALQDTPFERIVQALSVGRDPAVNPLVQVWFTFQDAPLALRLPGLEVASEALHNGGAKLDLSLWYWDDGERVRGLIEYNDEIFEPQTVRRLHGHLREVVAQIAADERQAVGALRLLGTAELETEFGPAARFAALAPVTAGGFAGPFFERAGRDPGSPCLRVGDAVYTAGQLADWAEAIAAELRHQGVVPGTVVGVCLERGAPMLAALLGVLRCGAAYLPLDPSLPPARIEYMLQDSAAGVALMEPATAQRLPDRVVALAAGLEPRRAQAAIAMPELASDDLAYLIYTSGSSGRPKGVRIGHGAVANFLAAMRERPGLRAGERVLAVTTYAFDISVLELFLPLIADGLVQIGTRAEIEDGQALAATIERHAIDLLQATPATWRLLRGAGWTGRAGLRALVGGEALAPELARWLLPRVGELWNMYGPTETTVWSSCARIDAATRERCPIGTPIRNTTLHAIDPEGRVLPTGVPGELVIGGDGLALGYHQRAELDVERFVRLRESGARVYRTGDRARRGNDGQWQHLGRIDAQLKVRGFRIEPGEIESVLAEVPGVDEAAVRDWRYGDDDHRIVAYYAQRAGAPEPTLESIRERLRAMLPPYMVPQQLIALASLPRLPNGKLDRAALPPPHDAGAAQGPAVVPAALSPQEQLLLDLWRELIGRRDIDAAESFFDAGGHSLLALQMSQRVERATGVRLDLLRIANSSLRALAQDLSAQAAADAGSDAGTPAGIAQRIARWVRRARGPEGSA